MKGRRLGGCEFEKTEKRARRLLRAAVGLNGNVCFAIGDGAISGLIQRPRVVTADFGMTLKDQMKVDARLASTWIYARNICDKVERFSVLLRRKTNFSEKRICEAALGNRDSAIGYQDINDLEIRSIDSPTHS